MSPCLRHSAPVLVVAFLLGTILSSLSAKAEAPESFDDRVSTMESFAGFLPFYWDEISGKVFWEVSRLGEEFIYVDYLATGLGSNPVGLDRGALGEERLVRFERVGPRLFLAEANQKFRALSDDPMERRAVEESFASSVLWAGEIEAESGGRLLVDATSFLFRDVHDVVGTLESADQGNFSLDTERSSVHLPGTKAFPRNSEISVNLTFQGSDPGRLVRETAPDPKSITFRLRHSFIALPEEGFIPREFDPRIGGFHVSFADYAASLDEVVGQRWIERHRLEKVDPGAASSPVIRPIVYYVDSGAPDPVRAALVDGARWWADAFEAAGFENAFRVEVLPADADPLDVRYNVIQWVHRSTRGWSYGDQIVDPRTGEIIKGHVSLGSLRVRQDRLIFEGLFGHGSETTDLALARTRQLAAHEVGHTLGFAHNFAASVSDRASVMDYPAPWIQVVDGKLDASKAYDEGIGEWDKLTAKFAYSQFESGADESAELEKIVQEAAAKGLHYMSDRDARGAGSGHPLAHLWDNGSDPLEALREILSVRSIALEQFGLHNLAPDQPIAQLEEVLVPVYLLHRFQIDAAAKSIGGAYYAYETGRDAGAGVVPVEGKRQAEALSQLMEVIQPRHLRVPEQVIQTIVPHPIGYDDDRERFPRRTRMYFDPLTSAEAVCDQVVGLLLHPERAARLENQHLWDDALPDFDAVVQSLVENTWGEKPRGDAYDRALRRVAQISVVHGLMRIADDGLTAHSVRAIATDRLRQLSVRLNKGRYSDDSTRQHEQHVSREVTRFLARPHPETSTPTVVHAPPGSPIGSSHRCEF